MWGKNLLTRSLSVFNYVDYFLCVLMRFHREKCLALLSKHYQTTIYIISKPPKIITF